MILLSPYFKFLRGIPLIHGSDEFTLMSLQWHALCHNQDINHFLFPRKPYGIVLLTSQLSERRKIILVFRGQMPCSFQRTLNPALGAQWVSFTMRDLQHFKVYFNVFMFSSLVDFKLSDFTNYLACFECLFGSKISTFQRYNLSHKQNNPYISVFHESTKNCSSNICCT